MMNNGQQVQSVSGLVVPAPRTPQPSAAPPGDREAADLRARLGAAGWVEDAKLCWSLHRWQAARGLDDATAAREIGLPHVGAEVFKRLRELRKPLGFGLHWPELRELKVAAEVELRISATASPSPVTPAAPTASTSTPTVDLAAMVAQIRERGALRLPRTDAPELCAAVAALVADAGSVGRAGRKLAVAAGEPKMAVAWANVVRGYCKAHEEVEAAAKGRAAIVEKIKRLQTPAGDAETPAAVAVARVADAVTSELRGPGRPAERTEATAKLIADAMRRTERTVYELGSALDGIKGTRGGTWQMRFAAYVQAFPAAFAGTPTPAVRKPTIDKPSLPLPSSTPSAVEELAAAVDAEVGPGKERTEAVARRVVAVRGELGCSLYGLATRMGGLYDRGTTSWHNHLRAYVAAFPVVADEYLRRSVIAALPAAPQTSKIGGALVGRPRLTADGKLRVTVRVTVDSEQVVGPGDELWAAAVEAMNAA